MLLYDYHMHTEYSPDSKMPLENLIKKAISFGLKEICITDHVDNEFATNYHIPNYTKFLQELEQARQKFPEITIKFGCELSLSPNLIQEAEKVSKIQDFDFIIGSSHETNNTFLFRGTDYFVGKTKKDAFTSYFQEILFNVQNNDCFNVYGHLDYIYRYSNYPDNSLSYYDYKDIIDETLKTLIHKGKGIEINTSGFRYGLNNIHPYLDILKAYKNLGGEIITVGSDSHQESHVYDGFDFAEKALIEAGFKYITTFDKQIPSFVKI